jgi:hypothetical protein
MRIFKGDNHVVLLHNLEMGITLSSMADVIAQNGK